MIESWLFIVGFLFIIEKLIEIVDTGKAYIRSNDLTELKGSWALVTACTDGIGLAFSYELAKKGLNVIQVSRNPSKLAAVANDLISKYGIQVKNIARDINDCTKDPSSFFSEIYEQCEDLDVSILVNNIGTGERRLFIESNISLILSQLTLNLFPVVFLSRLFIEKLSKRKESYIINLSSIVAEIAAPYGSVYAASKSYDKVFSQVFAQETNVRVVCVQPSFVDTPMSRKIKNRILTVSNHTCVLSTLNSIRYTNRTFGHWLHWLSYIVMMFFQDIITYFAKYIA